MWEWIKRWRSTGQSLPGNPPLNTPELYAAAIDKLAEAQREHIRDLRTLIDQAHERERELAGMVKLVMEERFAPPVITGRREAKPLEGPDPETLNDVQVFDETADGEAMKEQNSRHKELEKEFAAIMTEEQEYREKR